MNEREKAARAIAFFEATDDIGLLHGMLEEVAPRAKRAVGRYLARGSEEAIPGPADIRAAREAAGRDEAIATIRTMEDFPLLQALSRAIGRRIEAIEIAASAEFPEGVRVRVPERGPKAGGRAFEGVVEETGTMLRVHLDNGETWQGPPSLARLAGQR